MKFFTVSGLVGVEAYAADESSSTALVSASSGSDSGSSGSNSDSSEGSSLSTEATVSIGEELAEVAPRAGSVD